MFKLAFSTLLIGSIALLAGIYLLYPSGANELGAIYGEWISFAPWSQASINRYTGIVTSKTGLSPVPVIAVLLGLSLLAYALLLLVFKTKIRFDWRIVATLTIVCWMTLDLLWQTRLLQQLVDTRQTFAGMEHDDKLAATPNGWLFQFIKRVKQKSDTPNARFFIGTSDEYFAILGTYYLYPKNAYWKRYAPELPDKRYLHKGDYIVIVRPSTILFDRRTNILLLPDNTSLTVEQLMEASMGGLFRVL